MSSPLKEFLWIQLRSRLQTMLEWQTPRLVRDVQCFLGFVNFYRKFIQDYSKLILPLTQLTKKDQSFV